MVNSTNAKDKLILIADDDETVVEVLKFSIEQQGFRNIVANDGIKAIGLAKSEHPDLILLDMMMPQKGGYEVIKELQTGEYRDIPIIIITGRLVDDNTRNMMQFEPNVKDYITKPLKLPYLFFKIHSILGTVSPEEKSAQEKKKTLEEKQKPKQFNE